MHTIHAHLKQTFRIPQTPVRVLVGTVFRAESLMLGTTAAAVANLHASIAAAMLRTTRRCADPRSVTNTLAQTVGVAIVPQFFAIVFATLAQRQWTFDEEVAIAEWTVLNGTTDVRRLDET